jgi:hypothetical protein
MHSFTPRESHLADRYDATGVRKYQLCSSLYQYKKKLCLSSECHTSLFVGVRTVCTYVRGRLKFLPTSVEKSYSRRLSSSWSGGELAAATSPEHTARRRKHERTGYFSLTAKQIIYILVLTRIELISRYFLQRKFP